MIFRVPENIQLWEGVAVVQIVQHLNNRPNLSPNEMSYVALVPDLTEDTTALFQLGAVGCNVKKYDGDEKTIELIQAYGSTHTADMYYGQVLMRENGLQVAPLRPPYFPFIRGDMKKQGIIVCPFGLRPEFDIPTNIWKDVIKQLQSYDPNVYVLGERRQRLDEIGLTENEILSDLPLSVKLQTLASAKLVVGVANSWTWLSSAWVVNRILIHPDNIRNDRWYPAMDNTQTEFLLQNREILSSPMVQVGIRKMMRKL